MLAVTWNAKEFRVGLKDGAIKHGEAFVELVSDPKAVLDAVGTFASEVISDPKAAGKKYGAAIVSDLQEQSGKYIAALAAGNHKEAGELAAGLAIDLTIKIAVPAAGTGIAVLKSSTAIEKLAAKVGRRDAHTKRTELSVSEVKGNSGEYIGYAKSTLAGQTGFSGNRGAPLKQPDYQPSRNTPTTIKNRKYSAHALDQMQNRGIPPSVIEDTISPSYYIGPGNRSNTRVYYSSTNGIRVVINNGGDVITVITAPRH